MDLSKKEKYKSKKQNNQLHNKNLSNKIKRPLHFFNFITKKENKSISSKTSMNSQINKTNDGIIYNQKFLSLNKKPTVCPVKNSKINDKIDKISLHKNLSKNSKINSVTLPSESAIKNSSQFLAFKYLRPNSIKDKYDFIMINKPYKSINTNNYIINTLNVSEKNYTSNSLIENKKNMEKDISKYKQEKQELTNKIKEQKAYIEKLMEKNQKLDDKYNNINQENVNIRNQYNTLKENQEQLIMLIKIIQENGVDVEGLIDKWNNEVEKEEKENEEDNNKSSDKTNLEMNKEHEKYEFLPITVDKIKNPIKTVKGIPKLNFDELRNPLNNQK